MVRALSIGLCLTLLSGASFAGSPDPASLTVPPEQIARARDLVRLLASDLYRDRDAATRELEAMGRLALPALADARNESDPEVQTRVAWLYPLAVSEELQARIACFLADTKSQYRHDLPGWSWFRFVAGDEPSTRDLFVEIVKNKANQEVLLGLSSLPPDKLQGLGALVGSTPAVGAYQPTGGELPQAVLNRRQQLQLQMMPPFPPRPNFQPVQPKVSDLALLLLAESLAVERENGNNGMQFQLVNHLYQSPGRDALAGRGPHGAPFRKLAIYWLDTREGITGISNAINIAQTNGMDKATVSRYAAKMMLSPHSRNHNRAHAATVIAKNASKEHLFTLTKLFTDEVSLIRGNIGNPQPDINVQDCALAMAVILTGQSVKDYGLAEVNAGHQAMKFVYTNYHFPKDEQSDAETKRAAAFEKWRTWETTVTGGLSGPAIAAAMVEQKYAPRGAKK